MKIKLMSDFRDYYDHWFCGSHDTPKTILNRMSRNDISKPQQFEILRNIYGCQIPRVGVVSELNLNFDNYVVVYLDEFAHRGESKVKCKYKEALEKYPDKFASEFIDVNFKNQAISFRHLQFGSMAFEIKYSSYGTWMSNNAEEVEIKIIGTNDTKQYYKNKYPLFAIDFVGEFAIDFNTSPQIKGTGLEDIVSSEAVYKEIENFIQWRVMFEYDFTGGNFCPKKIYNANRKTFRTQLQ